MKQLWFLSLVVKLSGLFKPLSLSSVLSVLSLTVGVSTLLVSTALVDSYEVSFKGSIQSIFSHVEVYPSYNEDLKVEDIGADIASVYDEDFQITESHKKEGLLAYGGKVAGVVLEGVNPESVEDVIDFRSKLIAGEFALDGEEVSASPRVLVGKEIFKKFKLEVGKVFSIVIPQANYTGREGFSRKVFTYKVGGVVDLGRHSYNKRFIVAHKFHVNKASVKSAEHFSKISVRIADGEKARELKKRILASFPEKYWAQSWEDKSGPLLEAIAVERWVIFFLVLILVVVAAFNVSTNLYLNLSKRLKEFSVLQTIGMPKKDIAKFMILNGLLLAGVGVVCGLLLSFLIMYFCNYLLAAGIFVPPAVYKLTSIEIVLSYQKFLLVSASTFILCFLASLSPAFSVYKLSIVKGLRYE